MLIYKEFSDNTSAKVLTLIESWTNDAERKIKIEGGEIKSISHSIFVHSVSGAAFEHRYNGSVIVYWTKK